MGMNKWLGIGRLTADPEIRQTQSGVPVCSFNMAINRPFMNGGERKADFIPVTAWRGTAEFVAKYFSKGDPIQVEGSLETNIYEKDGSKRFDMKVTADKVSFVEGVTKNSQQEKDTPIELNGVELGGEFAGFVQVVDDDDLPF